MAWWIAIQPKWRLTDDGSFVYSSPTGEDWRFLHKGGSAGLYTVVVALSWWLKALSPADCAIRAWTAVHDVQWVIDQINGNFRTTLQGKKRGSQEPEQSGRAKRWVSKYISFYNISYNDSVLDDVKNLSSPGGQKRRFQNILAFIMFYKDFILDDVMNLSVPGGLKGRFQDIFIFIICLKLFYSSRGSK